MYRDLLLLYLFNGKRLKKIINEINQRLKLWARVPIAVRSCPAAAHMYR